jgi:hypothetical protein
MTDSPSICDVIIQLTKLVETKRKQIETRSLKLQIAKDELAIVTDRLNEAKIAESRQKRIKNMESFRRFKAARIRRQVGESTTIKELCRAYKCWMEEFGSGRRALSGLELENMFKEEYGEPEDHKTMLHIRIFYDDESVKKYDEELEL